MYRLVLRTQTVCLVRIFLVATHKTRGWRSLFFVEFNGKFVDTVATVTRVLLRGGAGHTNFNFLGGTTLKIEVAAALQMRSQQLFK